MNLPKLSDIDISGKRVLLRLDLDLPEGDDSRLESSKETLDYLIKNKAKIIIIAHKGQPKGSVDGKFSLASVAPKIEKLTGVKVNFIYDTTGHEAKVESENLKEGEIILLENLRFDKREKENDQEFAKTLASFADVYVNEAFATSHRSHASIVGVPKLLPHAAGIRFEKEVENLSKVTEEPKRPLLVFLSGVKKDKIEMIEPLSKMADKVLIGGRLPDYMGDDALESVRLQGDDAKVIVGNLNLDKEDITLNTIDRFSKEALKAGTIVLAGVFGKYEDEGHRQGTEKVFTAIANSQAFKIVGGGDSLNAIKMFSLENKFNWISVGGGAMVEFLANKTLPGIEALRNI